ncbi:MAG TPA: hypothetical protein VNA25_30120 [Phycisphaerae bacterium]|nr:hypothetical protein [Phycisphaerae bacterium]
MNHDTNETGAGITVACKVHFKPGVRGRRRLRQGEAPVPPTVEPGRVPRLARLMALAIHFDGLVRKGEVRDYADLARLGHVTRARATQIMNLLNLAPDIQEGILFLPRASSGRDPISERKVRRLVAEFDWREQRRLWQALAYQTIYLQPCAPTNV